MWRRDSGEFVMSKCKIRQQAQLAELEGTRSQQLYRAEYCRRGGDSLLSFSVTNTSVCEMRCMVSERERNREHEQCLKMNCA